MVSAAKVKRDGRGGRRTSRSSSALRLISPSSRRPVPQSPRDESRRADSPFFFLTLSGATMDRNESTNEGSSSPDTVIARSSSEEEKQKPQASTSREYITVGGSSSSLDTLTSGGIAILSSSVNTDDRKRGKFGAFKSSLREGGIFKIKKRPRPSETDAPADPEQDDKG